MWIKKLNLVIGMGMLVRLLTNVIEAVAALPRAELISPENGAENQRTTLTLKWEPVSGANVYRVFISTCNLTLKYLDNTAIRCPGCHVNTTFSNSYEVPYGILEPETWYAWMVRAETKSGEKGENSYIYGFTTGKDIDLIVENPYSNSSVIKAGSSVSVFCFVKNQGRSLAVSRSKLTYCLSSGTTYNSSVRYLGYSDVPGDLGSGQSTPISGYLKIPSDMPSGEWYILFIADVNSEIEESREDNNVTPIRITIQNSSPDLTVQNQTVDLATLRAGQATDISCDVKNLGTVSAGASKLKYYLSNNTLYDLNDLNLGAADIDTLAANDTALHEDTVLIPFDTPPGNWYILFRADADGTVTESNENNNVAYQQIKVEESRIGAVNVTIEPAEVIAAGAKWRVVDWIGANGWRNSGETETGYYPENEYYIEFNDIPGWKKPEDIELVILAGQTVYKTGTYIRESSADDTPVKIVLQCPNPDDDHCHRLCNGAYHIAGKTLRIRWVNETTEQLMDSVEFYYSVDGGEWEHIWTDSEPNHKTETFECPVAEDFIHDDVRVKIVADYTEGGRSEDVSKSIRIIDSKPPVLTVSKPAEGEVFEVGQPLEIRWNAECAPLFQVERVDLKFLPSAETTYLYGTQANSGSYTWYPQTSDITDRGQVQITVWASNCTESVSETGYFEIRNPEEKATDCSPADGMFVVGSTGQVGIDWLYDGGMYEGELGIFSLEGMDLSVPDVTAFIEESLRRVMSGTREGYIVLSDAADKARFSGVLGGEPKDWNEGELMGQRTFEMTPGDRFALVLVPNSSFENLAANPGTSDAYKRPLFSFTSPNADYGMYMGQVADINGKGQAFVFEDMEFSNSDKDYNDLIIQISGACSGIASIDEILDSLTVSGGKRSKRNSAWFDWRTDTELGRKIMAHIEALPATDDLWTSVSFEGRANLTVYDAEGRLTGVGKAEIPGSLIQFNGNSVTVSLPSLRSRTDYAYRIVLLSPDKGIGHLLVKGNEGYAETASKSESVEFEAHQVLRSELRASSDGELIFDFGQPEIPKASDGTLLRYDFDADGKIDDKDIERVSSLWNTCKGDAAFDPFFDLDDDGCITVLDIMRVGN